MDEKFKCAIERTLAFEGGYVNDPDDPGGETNFGISKRSYPKEDIKHMTRDRAIEIYNEDYWMRYGFELIVDPAIAGTVFDKVVNMGSKQAVLLLQRTLNRLGAPSKLAEDGALGMQTLEAVNEYPHQALLLAELKLTVIGFYTDLAIKKGMQKFLAGWVRRALA
jgi:lysozyme family protein